MTVKAFPSRLCKFAPCQVFKPVAKYCIELEAVKLGSVSRNGCSISSTYQAEMQKDTELHSYVHGHHGSVINDHSRRTARDSAAFLLPHIWPDFTILDVGCGTGTITVDLASLVPDGKVEGVDLAEKVLAQGRKLAESRNLSNVSFHAIDANALPFQDDHFDIVYCHQVLQHVQDPVKVLKEMRRVTRPGGIVAARDADYKSFAWYPEPLGLQKWAEVYQKAARENGGEPNAGRYLHRWAKGAGFELGDIEASWHSWRYSGERAVQFAQPWKDRVLHSNYADTARKHELASKEELEEISNAWDEWSKEEDAFIAIPHGEILCRKQKFTA